MFNALNAISKNKDNEIFDNVRSRYINEVATVTSSEYVQSLTDQGKTTEEIEDIQDKAIKDAILKEYDKQKSKHGFLWVQNLWKSDSNSSPYTNLNSYKAYYEGKYNEILDETAFEEEFNLILNTIKADNLDNNGYYILIILAGVVTFLVQWLSQRSMSKSNNTAGSTNKIMLFIMPLVMLIFASTSNALFTLYIITNSIVSAVISKIIDKILKDKDVTTSRPIIKSNNVVEYSRNYKN